MRTRSRKKGRGQLTASETAQTGYAASAWGGDCAANGTITLLPGDNKTCTITNDDIAPKLTLIKTVLNNDGGKAVVADFPLFVNGNPVTSGVPNKLSANTLYTASETGQPGYAASVWGGDCAADGTITLNEGESKTCTITDDDTAPKLKLVKNVITDNGGNAVANDWTLSATAAPPFDGRNFSSAGGSGVFETVYANQGYNLAESAVAGYATGSWSCDGGTLVGSTVTLAEGETGVTCKITNDDIAPTLTLIKIVVRDDGGDAVVADFPLFINGNPVTSGAVNTVSANTLYTASETTQPATAADRHGPAVALRVGAGGHARSDRRGRQHTQRGRRDASLGTAGRPRAAGLRPLAAGILATPRHRPRTDGDVPQPRRGSAPSATGRGRRQCLDRSPGRPCRGKAPGRGL